MNAPKQAPGVLQASWYGFLEDFESLRPDLYRYCRHLTQSPWDAEDLSQDTLARAFVILAQLGESPPNPRAWLFRVASNLWIDRVRRRASAGPRAEEPITPEATRDSQSMREAAGTLLGQLSPQERAAVVLKDVFELSLDETAEALSTTVGAIKTALHRARGKLVEPALDPPNPAPPAVLDAFCAAFNARDLDRLTALLLDTVSVEVVGVTTQYGPEAARRTVLWGMLFGVERMVDAESVEGLDARYYRDVLAMPPRVEARCHRGVWLLLHWYAHRGGEAVRAITRIDEAYERVAGLHNYFYNPEFVAEVCAELGLSSRSNGYHWCRPRQ